MKKAPRSETPNQDRLALQAAKSEELAKLAQRPDMPCILGKFVALEAWRHRPRKFEYRLARWSDEFAARTEARLEESDRRSEAKLAEAIGRYRRIKAGEPEIVPASTEVLQAQFADEQMAPDPPAQEGE